MTVVQILGGVGIVAFLIWLFVSTERLKAQVAEEYEERRQAITAMGGRYSSDKEGQERVEIDYAGIPILLETHYRRRNAHDGQWHLRCYARNLSFTPAFSIGEDGVLASLQKAFGGQDVVLGGSEHFDRHFVVKTDQPAAVRRIWTLEARALMLEHFSEKWISCSRDQLTLGSPGGLDWDRWLKAFDLLSSLASVDVHGVHAWTRLPGVHVEVSEAGIPEASVNLGARVVLATEDVRGALVTVARLDSAQSSSDAYIEVVHGQPTDKAAFSLLPQATQVHLCQAGHGLLVIDSQAARFYWQEIQLRPEALEAAARGLAALATASASAYR